MDTKPDAVTTEEEELHKKKRFGEARTAMTACGCVLLLLFGTLGGCLFYSSIRMESDQENAAPAAVETAPDTR